MATAAAETLSMLKDLAAARLKQGRLQDALDLYSQALQQVSPTASRDSSTNDEAAILSSNISAVLLRLDRPTEALEFAAAATQMRPHWPKGYYRQASALRMLQQHAAAVQALQQALTLVEQGSREADEIANKLAAAAAAAAQQRQHRDVQQQLLSSHASWAQNRAREARTRDDLMQQLQQGMAGCAWQPDDWEWRPTWTPSMRAAAASTPGATSKAVVGDAITSSSSSSSSSSACGTQLLAALDAPPGSTPQQQQQVKQLLAQLTCSLAGLEAPQRGLRLLQDTALLDWYQRSIAAAVATCNASTAGAVGRAPAVLVLANGGGGLLALIAAAAGAGRVVVVEKWQWGCRASKQLLEGNRAAHPELVGKIELVPGPLDTCYYEPMAGTASGGAALPQAGQAQEAEQAGASGRFRLTQQADVLVTDMLDFSVLGQGVLGAVHTAAAAGLLSPAVRLVPDRVAVQGQLVNTQLTQPVSGFDLSPINRYKWHPTIEHVQPARYQQMQVASSVLSLQDIELAAHAQQGRLSTNSSTGTPAAPAPAAASSASTVLQPGCSADALLVWCELHAGGFVACTGPEAAAGSGTGSGSCSAAGVSAAAVSCPDSSAAAPQHRSMFVSSGVGMGLFHLDSILTAPEAADQAAAAAVTVTTAHSPAGVRLVFDVALSPQEPTGAACGGLRAECSTLATQQPTAGSAISSSSSLCPSGLLATWVPHGFPRHAWLPRWHFDMLADSTRNDAYEAALRRAIAHAKTQHVTAAPADKGVHVLDLGAGTGLLSMLAVRCGADQATAVESVRHMADTANSVVALNSLLPRVRVVHKDARYLEAGAAADVLVFEVFDCGCIGEGALHIVAAARQHLRPGARTVPCRAQVFCQPIQYGAHIDQRASLPFDTSALAPYAWQPDYFEADLSASTTSTSSSSRPLAPAQPIFSFDFNCADPLIAFQPASMELEFAIDTPGIWNAMAFFFDLILDEHTTLSSSPYGHAGSTTTWKQAVQLLPEHTVQPGQVAALTASHDTFAISFQHTTSPTPQSHSAGSSQQLVPQPTGVALCDPLWRAAYDSLTALQSQVVKAIAQDPLEHRRVTAAALAMQPGQQVVAEGEHQTGGRQLQADPHHAAALLVRLMA